MFRYKGKAITNQKHLIINCQIILITKVTKFLGFVIDVLLLWYDHINLLKPKVSKCIGVLGKAR